MADPFREAAVAALAAIFDRMAADAVYTPAGGGAAVALKALASTVDQAALDALFPTRTLQTGRTFALLRAAVSDRPEKGATIALLDDASVVTETFTLVEPAISKDARRLVWLCTVGEPA